MSLILPVRDKFPQIPTDCFVAENATIVGDVVIGEKCSVWFNAVIRGDVNAIRIGDYCNIQDGAIIHCTYQRAATKVGNYVNIGHQAMVHGCTLRNYILIGMGAIVMDHAIVSDYVIIAAGAVVLENTVCESGHIYAGVPAKKVKPITNEQRVMLEQLPHNYLMYANWYK